MHEAKEKGNKIMHAYGPKSTPIAQGLVEDINAKHAYGPRSAMMMITFITFKSSLVPLFEGL